MKLKIIFKLIKSIPLRLRFLVFFAVLSIGLMIMALKKVIVNIGIENEDRLQLIVVGDIIFLIASRLSVTFDKIDNLYTLALIVVMLKKNLTLKFRLFLIVAFLFFTVFLHSIFFIRVEPAA